MEKKGIKKVSGFGHGDHYINIKVIVASILWRSLHHDQYSLRQYRGGHCILINIKVILIEFTESSMQ